MLRKLSSNRQCGFSALLLRGDFMKKKHRAGVTVSSSQGLFFSLIHSIPEPQGDLIFTSQPFPSPGVSSGRCCTSYFLSILSHGFAWEQNWEPFRTDDTCGRASTTRLISKRMPASSSTGSFESSSLVFPLPLERFSCFCLHIRAFVGQRLALR